MFIASVSHELRTTAEFHHRVHGVILKGMTGALNEKQHDQLTRSTIPPASAGSDH
jgi:hypothetical protein